MLADLAPGRRLTLGGLMLVMVSLTLYAYTIGNPLIWDSRTWILDDPSIRSLANAPRFFLEGSSPDTDPGATTVEYYRPLVRLLYAAEFALFGTAPFGYHLVNVLLDAAVVLSLFLLLRSITGDLKLSFLASLIYAVNPARSEAVYWVFGASELLMALALLWALNLYHRGRHLPAALALSAGLLSRETAVLFPLILGLYELLVAKGGDRRRYLKIAPYAGIVGIYLVIRTFVLGALPPLTGVGPITLANTIAVVVARYLKILIIPDAPVAHYPLELFPTLTIEVIASYIVTAGAICALVLLVRRAKPLAFWLAWGFVWLAAGLNVGRYGDFLMMEKWSYLASAGFCVVAASFLVRLRFAPAVVTVLVLLQSGIVVARSTYWRDPVTYHEQVVAFAPEFPLARYMLALQYVERSDYGKAAAQFEQALAVDPDHSWALNNLANCYYMLGDHAGAERYWTRAYDVDPANAYAAYNLGMLAERSGDLGRAVKHYKLYLSRTPDPSPAILERIADLERRLATRQSP